MLFMFLYILNSRRPCISLKWKWRLLSGDGLTCIWCGYFVVCRLDFPNLSKQFSCIFFYAHDVCRKQILWLRGVSIANNIQFHPLYISINYPYHGHSEIIYLYSYACCICSSRKIGRHKHTCTLYTHKYIHTILSKHTHIMGKNAHW